MSISRKMYIAKYRKKIQKIVQILETSSDVQDLETAKILSTTKWNEFSVDSWLTQLINNRVKKNYKSSISIQVYSVLTGLPYSDIKELMRAITPISDRNKA